MFPSIPLEQKLYDYTVVGAAKASIDTGVDNGGNGAAALPGIFAVLEVLILVRTDDAAARAFVDVTVNNDTSAIYDFARVALNNATVTGASILAAAKWELTIHGAGGSASYASAIQLTIPAYAGTTFWKSGNAHSNIPDATAANTDWKSGAIGYRSTNAITRLKVAAQSTALLQIGSRLLIYGR